MRRCGRVRQALAAVTRAHHGLNGLLFDRGAYLRFYEELITGILREPGYLLHLGSGDGTTLRRRYERAATDPRIVSVDIDREALVANPARLRVVGDAAALPFRDGVFRAVCSEHLLEHLTEPLDVFRECRRVLDAGGCFAFAAPHGWSYVALAARLTPFRMREALVSLGASGRARHRHFPTHYRANSPRSIRRLARTAGFAVERLEGFIGEPCYTTSVPVLHLVAVGWHKILEILGLHRVAGLSLVGLLVRRG